jgi:hypothetical protein
MKKLIYGVMPPRLEHLTLAKRIGIRPYTKNDMFHMMLEMEYIMPIILSHEMYYLMHHFPNLCTSRNNTPYVGSTYHKELISFYVGSR